VTGVLGIHHVTAIASDPQKNLDFYVGLLGLRLVKRTVNFDDPETYHLYFGDEVGTPGSIMTFFPWPGARPGRQGTGQVAVTAFAVLPRALGFWVERFVRHGVTFEGPTRQVISFKDHDGLMLQLVGHAGAEGAGTVDHVAWRVPDGAAQLGMRERVTLAGLEPTPVIDRNYFHSVYFREPGGVLFELATDPPGFAIDEPVARFGERLMLP